MEFSYDTDPKQAAQSRVKMLTMLAANKTAVIVLSLRVAGLWPRRQGRRGFHYYPEPMAMLL